jgi:tetratricopeptide (TPR) repeat protein
MPAISFRLTSRQRRIAKSWGFSLPEGIQGDNSYYRGDYESAGTLYKEAYDAASRTADREIMLKSRFNLAKLSLGTGNVQSATASLESIRESANSIGLKYRSFPCTIYFSKAQIQSKKHPHAQVELQHALAAGEKICANDLLAQCHALLGQLAGLQGNTTESQRQHQEAVRILVGIQEEAHSDLQRERLLADKIWAISDCLMATRAFREQYPVWFFHL